MDMSQYVIPRSDQMNADDLIAGPRTITVTKVSGTGNPDQPVAVYFDGDAGKPYKPGKSMRRVMIAAWGKDASEYVGKQMTLYCDPGVVFGGMKVGGIRISHMSDIERDFTTALTVTKAKRAPFTVKRLVAEAKTPSAKERLFAAARVAAGKGQRPLDEFRASLDPRANKALDEIGDELARLVPKPEIPAHDQDGVIEDAPPADDADRDYLPTDDSDEGPI